MNNSNYERPQNSYRCGRGVMWKKECWQGPRNDGRCGGVFECKPQKNGDRYLCTRPQNAGGVCKQGPLPDGNCCLKRPACSPVPSNRVVRKYFTLISSIALISIMTLILALNFNNKTGSIVIEPGELTSIHAAYTEDIGCSSCHKVHDSNLHSWIKSVFTDTDISNQCLDCHGFHEPQMGAHNFEFNKVSTQNVLTVECSDCHKEHKGSNFEISEMKPSTCNNCHEKKFNEFEAGHPEFPEKFPSSMPNSINFNHATHLEEYFVDPKWIDKPDRDKEFATIAKDDCTVCHSIDSVKSNRIKPKGFEEICSSCHLQQVRSRNLVFFRPDLFTAVSGLLLNVSEDEEDEKIDDYIEMLNSFTNEPGLELSKLIETLDINNGFSELFLGINPLLLKSTAEKWVDEEDLETELSEELKYFGWLSGYDEDYEQTFRYKAYSHNDPIIKEWLELTLNLSKKNTDGKINESAIERLRETMLDKKTGPGACAKCHLSGLTDEVALSTQLTWKYRINKDRKFTNYSHGPHINLLNPSENCIDCHELDKSSKYHEFFKEDNLKINNFNSNFLSIKKEKCDTCHKRGKIDASCTQCHRYHYEPINKKVFNKDVKKSNS